MLSYGSVMAERKKEGINLKKQIVDYSPVVIGVIGLVSSVSGWIDRTEFDLRKEVGEFEIQWAKSLSEREWEVLKSLDNIELREEKKVNYIKQNGGNLYERYIGASNFGSARRAGGLSLLGLGVALWLRRLV